VFDDGGIFLGSRGSNRDVTIRKRTQEELQGQFAEISTIFDSLNAIVFVTDMKTDLLLYVNRFGAAMFGGEWQGKTCSEALQLEGDERSSLCCDIVPGPDGKPRSPHIWEFQNSVTGRWYQCTERSIKWPDGRVVRLEIAVDISDQKEMERMKDEMISAVSHEMRTPLTAMMGFTEFMLESEVSEEQRRTFLATIHKETARLNELISNFLDLQQIKARRSTYRFRSVAVEPLLRDAAALFAADHDRHRIEVTVPDDLPQIRGDETRLHQVLTNLISNAVKYSPKGSLVSLGARSDADSLTFWVRDEGQGIPLELLERIFDRFYRLDNTDRRLVGGTGLGLALVKEIVSAHNGRVWVESEPGKGSTFYVSLPLFVDSETGREEEQ
jgi:signal transduction histidine kinase